MIIQQQQPQYHVVTSGPGQPMMVMQTMPQQTQYYYPQQPMAPQPQFGMQPVASQPPMGMQPMASQPPMVYPVHPVGMQQEAPMQPQLPGDTTVSYSTGHANYDKAVPPPYSQ